MNERAMAQAAARGDHAAYEQLVMPYRRYIYAIAWKITMNEEDALDVTQETLAAIALKIASWTGEGAFRSWVAAIAANKAIQWTRQAGRRREFMADPEALAEWGGAANGGASDPAAGLILDERRAQVARAMAGLSPQQRAIFWLRWKEDMPPGEIAATLGIPPGQVRVQLHRAIEKIKQLVNNNEEKSKVR